MAREDELIRLMVGIAEVMHLDDLGRLLPGLRRAVGGSAALLYRFAEAGAPELVAGDLPSGMAQYAAEHFHTDPIHAAKRPLPPRIQVVPGSTLVDRRQHRSTAAYADFYAPNDTEFLASTWLTPKAYGDPGMTGVLVGRPAAAGDFERSDLAWLERLAPALAAAAARCARFEAVEAERRALEVLVEHGDRPVLVFDRRGRLLRASARAEGFAANVPESLTAEARRVGALAAAAPTTPPRYEIRAGATTAAFSIARSGTGEPLVLCILELDPVAELAARHGLTRAEAGVLALLAEGLSNDEIAKRLFVSLETVRTHVKRTLAKLEVPTRVQAALRVSALRARRS